MTNQPSTRSDTSERRRFSLRPDPYLLLLLALCLPALGPLLAPGYFYEAHDGRHSVFYPIQFDASLRSGALWPRWAMHHLQGYGYPTFVILAPAGFFVVELFVLLGAGFTTAAKLAWATGVLLSAWGMYRLVLEWLGAPSQAPQRAPHRAPQRAPHHALDGNRLAAVAAGALYVYAPYHLLDIYVRGALNESLLFVWLPWLFLAWDRLVTRGKTAGWQARLACAMLTLAATWLTHSFAILAITPLLAVFVLFRLLQRAGIAREWRAFISGGLLALAGAAGALLLSAVFLAPLIAESPLLDQRVYTSDTYDVANHFVQWGQYLSPFWGYGYSDDPSGANDGMGFQVGVISVVAALASLLLLGRRSSAPRGLLLFLLFSSLAVLALMAPPAAPLWRALPLLSVIQFPWRLLMLATFTLCALAGLTLASVANGVAGVWHETAQAGGLVAFAAMAVVAVAGYADPALQPVEPWREDGRAVYRFEEQFPDMIVGTQWTKEAFTTSPMSKDYASPRYAEEQGRTASLERFSVLTGEGEVTRQESAGSRFEGEVKMLSDGVVRANLLYFPGWQATVDGAPASIRVSGPVGLVEFDVPAGDHVIEVRFGSTPARRLGNGLAWAGVAIVGLLLLSTAYGRWRRREG